MSDELEDKARPRLSPRGAAVRQERERQLAQAMRANLRRRKAQARGRDETAADVVVPDDRDR